MKTVDIIMLVSTLYSNLLSQTFPPCLDDQLVQELLDSIPMRSSCLRDSCIWCLAFLCVLTIALLLKKGIITHLEPETKPHLVLLCHRTIQRCKEAPMMKDTPDAAR